MTLYIWNEKHYYCASNILHMVREATVQYFHCPHGQDKAYSAGMKKKIVIDRQKGLMPSPSFAVLEAARSASFHAD